MSSQFRKLTQSNIHSLELQFWSTTFLSFDSLFCTPNRRYTQNPTETRLSELVEADIYRSFFSTGECTSIQIHPAHKRDIRSVAPR